MEKKNEKKLREDKNSERGEGGGRVKTKKNENQFKKKKKIIKEDRMLV